MIDVYGKEYYNMALVGTSYMRVSPSLSLLLYYLKKGKYLEYVFFRITTAVIFKTSDDDFVVKYMHNDTRVFKEISHNKQVMTEKERKLFMAKALLTGRLVNNGFNYVTSVEEFKEYVDSALENDDKLVETLKIRIYSYTSLLSKWFSGDIDAVSDATNSVILKNDIHLVNLPDGSYFYKLVLFDVEQESKIYKKKCATIEDELIRLLEFLVKYMYW